MGIILEIILKKKEKKMSENRYISIIKKCGCPCNICKGKEQKMNVSLIEELIVLEEYLQKEVIINSGRRCPAENARVGGYPNSPHVFGEAVDIKVIGIELIALALICEKMAFLRIGIYPNHIHLDMIKPNPSRFWYIKKYGEALVYSGSIKNLDEFLKKVR
jgi:hypothetical protein